MSGRGIYVGVQELDLRTQIATCWWYSDETLDKDLLMKVPVDRLLPVTNAKVHRVDRESLKAAALAGFKATTANMKDSWFREETRKGQVQSLIKKEVLLTLKSRTFKRLSNMGPLNFEFDGKLLGIPLPLYRVVTYSYKSENLHQLDRLLGNSWDILNTAAGTHFITSLRVRVTNDSMMQLSFSAAVAMINVTAPHHRQQLSEYMQQHGTVEEVLNDDEDQVSVE